ncbi:4'-phosphopantetheinyl transferase family protein [Conexibacter woesei]|uniref:4'-phosphopantetheinyl transferase n=1 Tax=Conexibacter woesei (strain DSM 14684 / CCUG 47730 / CIP 108061 / JCM 11494 / NBRC 100937 / ID131577) TaxID=469383 RepID=D3F7L6_CONWI|nr:4'-phosphopantetheinyl transferase superfamily protein [Conexibacter woesei]ADB50878.1 4'-phosphopantetheinyl transferase [Conexibacter woesei DSM 14684]
MESLHRRGGVAVCDVHWARVDRAHAALAGLLDDDERARRERFSRDADRSRFTVAAALLRVVAGELIGCDPRAVAIDRTCVRCGAQHGRPRIAGGALEASVSHSGDYAAVAVTRAGPVGVDVERIRPLDHGALADDVCAPQERDAVTGLSAFHVLWTRKESALKATGAGLTLPLEEVVVTAPTEPPRLLALPGEQAPAARMADLSPAAGYAAAATVLTAAPVAFRQQRADARLADL